MQTLRPANVRSTAGALSRAPCALNLCLRFALLGSTTSNRDGIGARVSVAANGTTQIREISAGSGSLGQSSLTAHFGMGGATEISSVSVRWPSGRIQQLTGIAVDQTLTIEEP